MNQQKPHNTEHRARFRRWLTAAEDDDWFTTLGHGPRALFKALATSRDIETCGTIRASLDALARLVGYDKCRWLPRSAARWLLKSQMKALHPKVMWWPEHDLVFVRNYTRHQGSGEKFHTGAVSRALDLPKKIRAVVMAEIEKPHPNKPQ